MSVTLKDLEVRYANILKDNPKAKLCSVKGCKNPQDATPLSGKDTCCAYHRLLFDFWSCEGSDFSKFQRYLVNQKARRNAFTKWRNRLGKDECDKIVLMLAQEPINWDC